MPDVEESKADKFVRLKDARLGKVMDGMRILKNITNIRDYDYTEDQALEVVETIQDSVDDLNDAFGLPPRATGETRITPDTSTVDTKEADDNVETDTQPMPEGATGSGDWKDKSNTHPRGVTSNITEVDGKKLLVKPGDWDGLMMIRFGPHLGLALEAVMDGDNEKAKELLLQVMTT